MEQNNGYIKIPGDTRDLRDPQILGERLMNNARADAPLASQRYDKLMELGVLKIPDYKDNNKPDYAFEYRVKLAIKAAGGDKQALDVLKGIEEREDPTD